MEMDKVVSYMTKWHEFTPDSMPEPGVACLIHVKEACIRKDNTGSKHTKKGGLPDPLVFCEFAVATLVYELDGFGRRFPKEWRCLGVSTDNNDSTHDYGMQIRDTILLAHVTHWGPL